jgi:PadR family transcriptional regulator PadR
MYNASPPEVSHDREMATQSSASLMSGVSELLILKLLATREMYGYELARTIRLLTADGIVVGESVLYPTLHLLEKRGLIRSRRKSVEGRTRVYYAATAKGKRRLEGLTDQWQRILKGVEAIQAGPQGA